jgi:hypothetical protein
VKHTDHQKITGEVAKRIACGVDMGLLVTASGEAADLTGKEGWGHHSTKNTQVIARFVRQARKECLERGTTREFQRRLGYALHYMQDLLAYATAEPWLQGESLTLHDRIEAKLSRYTNSIAYEGIAPKPLDGWQQVHAFIMENVELTQEDPEVALRNPQAVLERCFRACLSVANAVVNNDIGFDKGSEAITARNAIVSALERIGEHIQRVEEASAETSSDAKFFADLERSQWASLSLVGKALAAIRGKGLQHRHKRAVKRIRRPFLVQLNTLERIKREKAEAARHVGRLRDIADAHYEEERAKRELDGAWYGVHRQEFPTVDTLRTFITAADEELRHVEQRGGQIECTIQEEMRTAVELAEQAMTTRD